MPLSLTSSTVPTTMISLPNSLPFTTTQQAARQEATTTPAILDTQLSALLQQYLCQAIPQQPTIQPQLVQPVVQRVNVDNLSPASDQDTVAPQLMDNPHNIQPHFNQTTHPSVNQLTAVNTHTCATLPVPTQLRQQIINGEYTDFGVLLSKCSYDDARHVTSSHTQPTPILSLATWMEAWNIYAMVMHREHPAKALISIHHMFSQ